MRRPNKAPHAQTLYRSFCCSINKMDNIYLAVSNYSWEIQDTLIILSIEVLGLVVRRICRAILQRKQAPPVSNSNAITVEKKYRRRKEVLGSHASSSPPSPQEQILHIFVFCRSLCGPGGHHCSTSTTLQHLHRSSQPLLIQSTVIQPV